MEPHLGGGPREVPRAPHAPIPEIKQLSKEDQLFFEAMSTKNEPKIAELKEKKLVPSSELILHAIQKNMIDVAMRALQANPHLKPEELLAIRKQAYAAKSEQLVAATLQKGVLPTAKELETAVRDWPYELLDKLLEPYRTMTPKPSLLAEDGSHLILYAISRYKEKAFDLLKDIVDLDVKVGTRPLLEQCLQLSAKNHGICGKLCLQAICNAQEKRTQSERDAYAMYLFGTDQPKAAFVKLYTNLYRFPGLDSAPKKDDLVFKFISLCGAETRWNALCAPQDCILNHILHDGGGFKIAQMLITDDPNFEKRDSSGGTLLHHLAAFAAPNVFISLIGWARNNGINLARALDIKRSTDQKTPSDLATDEPAKYRQIPLDLLRFESEAPRSGNELLQFIDALPKYNERAFRREIRFPLLTFAQSRGASLLQDANILKEALEDCNITILTLIANEQKQKGIKPDYRNCDQNFFTLKDSLQEAYNSLGVEELTAAMADLFLLFVDQFVGLDPLFETEERLKNLLRLCGRHASGAVYQKLFEIATEKNKKAMLFTCMLSLPGHTFFEDLKVATMVQRDPATFYPILLNHEDWLPYTLCCCLDGFLIWEGRNAVLSPKFIRQVLYAAASNPQSELASTKVLQEYLQQCGSLTLPQPSSGWPQGTRLSNIAISLGLPGPSTILLQEEKKRDIKPDPLKFDENMQAFERMLREQDPQRIKGAFLSLCLEQFIGWEAIFQSSGNIIRVLNALPPETRAESIVLPLSTLLSHEPDLFLPLVGSEEGAKVVGRHLLDHFLAWDGSRRCDLSYLMAYVFDNFTESDPRFRQCLQLAIETNCDFTRKFKTPGQPLVDLVTRACHEGHYESCFAMQRALLSRGTPLVGFWHLVAGHDTLEFKRQLLYFLRGLPSIKKAMASVPDDAPLEKVLFTDEFQAQLSLEEKFAFWWELGLMPDKPASLPDIFTLEYVDTLFLKIQAIEPGFTFEALLRSLLAVRPQFYLTLLESERGARLVGTHFVKEFLGWKEKRSAKLAHLLVFAINEIQESTQRQDLLNLAIEVGYNFGKELEEAGGQSLLSLAIEKGYVRHFFQMVDVLRAAHVLLNQKKLPPHFTTMHGDIWRSGHSLEDRFQRYLRALPSLKNVVQKIPSPDKTDLTKFLFTEEFQEKLTLAERIAFYWELGNFAEMRRIAKDLSAKELEALLRQIKKIEPKFSVEMLISPQRLTENPRLFSQLLGSEQGTALIGEKYLDAFLRWDGARSSDLTRLMPYVIDTFPESDPRHKEYLALAIQSDCNFAAEYEPGKTASRLALVREYFESYFAMQSALIAQGRPNRNFAADTREFIHNSSWVAAFKKYVQTLPSLQRIASLPDLERLVLGGNIVQKLLPEEKIAFMWELGSDVRDSARGLPLEEVEKLFIKFRKIEPGFSLSDLIAPELDPAHFARPVPEIRIPPAPPGIDMYDLLNLFDAAAKGGHITESKLQSSLKLLVSDKKKEGIEDLRKAPIKTG